MKHIHALSSALLVFAFSLTFAEAEDIRITTEDGQVLIVPKEDLLRIAKPHKPQPGQRQSQASPQGSPLASALPPPPRGFRLSPGYRAKIVEPVAAAALEPGVGPTAMAAPLAVPSAPIWPLGAFRLRSAWDPVKLFRWTGSEWVENESALDSDGAEFGWTRNQLNNSDQWSAKGVAYYPFVFNGPTTQFLLIPSVEFNRDTSTDGTDDEINSLIGRIGVDFNFVNPVEQPAKGYVVRTAAGYQTDFDFESGQWLFDVQFERVDEEAGVGVFAAAEPSDRSVRLPSVRQKLVLAPIFSLGSIQDVGDKVSLDQLDDTYGTIGFKAGIDFELEGLPEPFNTTKLGGEYRLWSTVGSNTEVFDYFEAHIVLPFGGTDDKLALKAFYRRGDTPETLEKVDLTGIALTAKF